MANSKVQLADGSVLIDLTSDTVDAAHLLEGYTAHDASGQPITGTMVIPSGDSITIDGIATGTEPSGAITINSEVAKARTFSGNSAITSACINSATVATSIFYSCSAITAIAVTQATYTNGRFTKPAEACNALKAIDVSKNASNSGTNAYSVGSSLDTLVLRRNGLVGLWGGVNCFKGTKFASGASGGTIYIPKSMYDHLGDGSSLDYKAASNWSTVDSYGTITWAQIEGSQYEYYYVDGTPIPS